MDCNVNGLSCHIVTQQKSCTRELGLEVKCPKKTIRAEVIENGNCSTNVLTGLVSLLALLEIARIIGCVLYIARKKRHTCTITSQEQQRYIWRMHAYSYI